MLALDKISFHVPGKKNLILLQNISFKIEEGSRVAVMGLNGSGKTTLLKIMSSYLNPSEGCVFFKKKKLREFGSKELAREIACVPQDFPTDFPFTVFEFVMMGRFAWQDGLFYQKNDFEKVEKILQRLSLTDFSNRVIATLSGGERQRVLLARAIVQESPVILLDEPLNHLDIKNKLEILKILREENQSGKTVIATMHDFQDVKENFTHVIFLKNGELKYVWPVAEGFERGLVEEVFDVHL